MVTPRTVRSRSEGATAGRSAQLPDGRLAGLGRDLAQGHHLPHLGLGLIDGEDALVDLMAEGADEADEAPGKRREREAWTNSPNERRISVMCRASGQVRTLWLNCRKPWIMRFVNTPFITIPRGRIKVWATFPWGLGSRQPRARSSATSASAEY